MIVLFPLIVIVYGPPAAGVFIFIFQFARLFTFVVSVFPFQLEVTKTLSPGLPQPHKLAESFCCSTMPEEIIEGNLNWASDCDERKKRSNAVKERLLIFDPVLGTLNVRLYQEKLFKGLTYLKGFEYFTSIVTFLSVSVFRNATRAALSSTERFINLG